MLQLFTVEEERWELKETSAMHSVQRLISYMKRITEHGHLRKECFNFGLRCVLPGLSFSDSIM